MSVRVRRRPAVLVALATLVLTGCSSATGGTDGTASTTAVATPATTSSAAATPTTTAAPSTTARPPSTRPPTKTVTRTATPAPTRTAARAARLPLDLDTGDAKQVITVVASSGAATRASLQRWRKSSGGWRRVGSAADAYLGSDGVGRASESTSKTPAGSFTLTQAFGRDSDPGTRLPYRQTTSDDYWISSPGSKYNTEQRCGSCGYDNGVNERLHDITPEYDHAVVIDYNLRTRDRPAKPGAGSAFFLHIANGAPTAGCVAIPRSDLVKVLRWLQPTSHPRILIGVR